MSTTLNVSSALTEIALRIYRFMCFCQDIQYHSNLAVEKKQESQFVADLTRLLLSGFLGYIFVGILIKNLFRHVHRTPQS